MTNVCSKKKKCANGKGNSKADSVCVRAFSRLCFTFVQLFTVFFFFSDRLCQYRNVSADKHAPLRSCSHFRT